MNRPLPSRNVTPSVVRWMLVLALFLFLGCAGGRKETNVPGASANVNSELNELQSKLRKNPHDVRSRVRLGMLLMHQQNYPAAIAQFDSALAHLPDLTAAKFSRAEAKYLSGRMQESYHGYLEVLHSPDADQYVRAIAERIGAPYTIRQLTAPPGEAARARFSPDGHAIVYQSNRDGNWEIYRAQPDGSHAVRLTHDPAADEAPCFSPDGRWIAFARSQDQSPRSTGLPSLREIYLMDTQTGENVHCLNQHQADDWNPVFSPRGEWMAFVSDRDDPRAVDLPDRQSDIFLFHLADSTITRFSQGFGDKSAPYFTPTGEAILYVNNVNGEFNIFEQKMGSAQSVSLLPKSGPKGAPQCSADGRRIVYFEKHDNNFDLFLFDRERHHIQRLTCDPAIDAFPAFSPEGNEIFFTSGRDGSYQIYAMNLRTPMARAELIETLRRLVEQQKLSSP